VDVPEKGYFLGLDLVLILEIDQGMENNYGMG